MAIGNVPFSRGSILNILKVIALTLTQFYGGGFRAPSSCPHWLSHSTVICDMLRRRQRAPKTREWSHILRANFLRNDFAFEIRLPIFEFLLVGKYSHFPLFLKNIDRQWCCKIFYSCNGINPSNSAMAEETETSQVWLQRSYFFSASHMNRDNIEVQRQNLYKLLWGCSELPCQSPGASYKVRALAFGFLSSPYPGSLWKPRKAICQDNSPLLLTHGGRCQSTANTFTQSLILTI